MRLFLGLLPPPDVARVVAEAARDALAPLASYASEDLHLTLVFLGDVRAASAVGLRAGLERAFADARPVHARIGGAGAFGGPGHERALWAGLDLEVEQRARLLDLVARGRALATACDVTLSAADLARPFTPHLTLARPRPREHPPAGFAALRFDRPWLAQEVHLFESVGRAARGPRYPVRATCRLRGA